jgi:hypothetical protein
MITYITAEVEWFELVEALVGFGDDERSLLVDVMFGLAVFTTATAMDDDRVSCPVSSHWVARRLRDSDSCRRLRTDTKLEAVFSVVYCHQQCEPDVPAKRGGRRAVNVSRCSEHKAGTLATGHAKRTLHRSIHSNQPEQHASTTIVGVTNRTIDVTKARAGCSCGPGTSAVPKPLEHCVHWKRFVHCTGRPDQCKLRQRHTQDCRRGEEHI